MSESGIDRVGITMYLPISLKQVLFMEENLAYVIHVFDRFFSIQLHLPYKDCQFLPHPGN